MAKEIPVYLFVGFLESGKTKFIQETFEDPNFDSGDKTLLLICEEGEEEYNPKKFAFPGVTVKVIEDKAELNPQNLAKLEKESGAGRVVIEYNGMWRMEKLYRDVLPANWVLYQIMTFVQAPTFELFVKNMGQLMMEKITNADMIIFNRCDGIEDLNTYKRNVKALNQTAEIIFEDQDGEIDEIMEEDLPYDLKADKIVLDDNTYGIWYLDSLDHVDRYVGKTIEFIGMVMKPEEFPKGYFVPGRMAMTCCAEDMTFLGFACVYDKIDLYQERDWVKVTAVVKKEYFADYEGEGPVLYAESVTKAKQPKEPVISFT